MNYELMYEELFEYVYSLEIIDTHEHLPYKETAREQKTDVLKEYLTHYFNRDLISAGLPLNDFQKAIDETIPLLDRWDLVEPYWELCRYTGYGRALDLSVQALYGIEKVSRSSIELLNHEFLHSLEPGTFERILKHKSNIAVSLLDSLMDENSTADENFFKPVFRINGLVFPQNWSSIKTTEDRSGIQITTFFTYLQACEALLKQALARGAVGFKCALAYNRSLYFPRTTYSEAENDFNAFFKVRHSKNAEEQVFYPGEHFQNYVMHIIMEYANKNNVTLQFHTGLQEGNGNYINNSDPTLLTNLFLEYPQVNFDLFHIGYPFQHKTTVLAKNFPHVFIDMCWAHIISPNASVNAILEWIDTVPLNKVSGFGGDYCFIDGVCGHQLLARQNITKALAIKVQEKLFSIDKAKQIAKMYLWDNPKALFGL
jgi:uncharacterized protein